MTSKNIKQLLAQAQKSIAPIDAELLLAHVLKKNRTWLITHEEQNIKEPLINEFQELVEKRNNGYSVAVLIGNKSFFGRNFFVNEHTLIPRPETELMVELVLEKIKNQLETTLIDIGTGTGCIPISISLEDKTKKIKSIYASDICIEALKMAKLNNAAHKTHIIFKKGHLFEPFLHKKINTAVIITANLPYLTQAQFDEEKSIQKEPHKALVAPSAGLGLYKNLFKQLHSYLKNHSKPYTVFSEIDPTQTQKMKDLIEYFFPKAKTHIKKDFNNFDRIVWFTCNQNCGK